MKKLMALLLSALMVTALFAGCGNDATSPDAPAAEKVINYANGAAPEVMDPISSIYAKTSIVMYNIYCGLTRIGANGGIPPCCSAGGSKHPPPRTAHTHGHYYTG